MKIIDNQKSNNFITVWCQISRSFLAHHLNINVSLSNFFGISFREYPRFFNCILAVSFAVTIAQTVSAEGTKTISPSPNSCTALALLPSRNNGDYLGCDESNRIYFRITDCTTENLFYGFNWQRYGSGTNSPMEYMSSVTRESSQEYGSGLLRDMYMKIFSPDGSLAAGPIPLPISGAGFISTYQQAIAGPQIGNLNPNGYLPLSFTPKTNGEYWIELYRSHDGGATQMASSVWSYAPYFDLTVATDSGKIHSGRVHCVKWGLIAIDPQTFANVVSANASPILYPMTDDGVVYKITFEHGFEPIDFNIALTRYGISNTGNWLKDRISRNNVVSPSFVGGYPVFLNPPDSTVYHYASLPASPVFADPGIIGYYPGPYTIRFYLSQAGDCRLVIDADSTSHHLTSNRVIEIPECQKGLNSYVWDGKDGIGNNVADGTKISIVVTYNKGRGNLPIYDAEINKGGFNIACIAPVKIDHLKIYWDDSKLSSVGSKLKNELNNLTSFGLDNSIVGSITPAHAWNGDGNLKQLIPAPSVDGNDLNDYQADDFGNVRTINSWFWGVTLNAVSSTRLASVSIEGRIWDFTNGVKKVIHPASGEFYVLLVDPVSFTVLSSSCVNADGSYKLIHCPINGTNMLLMLSMSPSMMGMPIPNPLLQDGWKRVDTISNVVTTTTQNLANCDLFIKKMSKKACIRGFVKDVQTLDPWKGATVFLFNQLEGKVYVAKTNDQGKYSFRVPVPCDGVIKAMDENSFNDCMPFSIDTIQTDSVQHADRDLILEKLKPTNQQEKFDPTLYHDGQQFEYKGAVVQHLNFAPCLIVASNVDTTQKIIQHEVIPSINSYRLVVVPFEGNVLQLGAFRIKKSAFEYEKKVAEKSGKHVIIVYADGFHKVQIPGFANRNRAREYAPQLEKLGFKAIYIPVFMAKVVVQVGEFSKEADALSAQKMWSERTRKPTIILYEDNLFKVRIVGFSDKAEAESFIEHSNWQKESKS
jgi:hypothetical protein